MTKQHIKMSLTRQATTMRYIHVSNPILFWLLVVHFEHNEGGEVDWLPVLFDPQPKRKDWESAKGAGYQLVFSFTTSLYVVLASFLAAGIFLYEKWKLISPCSRNKCKYHLCLLHTALVSYCQMEYTLHLAKHWIGSIIWYVAIDKFANF